MEIETLSDKNQLQIYGNLEVFALPRYRPSVAQIKEAYAMCGLEITVLTPADLDKIIANRRNSNGNDHD